jgi:hypothetical protein
MESTTVPAKSSSPAQSILVHVISPSTEVPNRLTFPEVPVSTTITELKKLIQDAIPTKPSFERQRIIYRGRPIIQPELTLASLFGAEAVRLPFNYARKSNGS